MGRGNFLGKGAAQCKIQEPSGLNCPKTAEPIKMPFGMLSRDYPGNHVLDGVQMLPQEGTLLGSAWPIAKRRIFGIG